MHNCKYCKREFSTRRDYEGHLPCPQRLRPYKPDEAPAVGTPDFSAGITNDAPDFGNVDSGSDFSGGGGESAGGGASGDW